MTPLIFPYILLSFMLINASNILYLFLQTKSSVNFQSLDLYTLFLCIYILNFVFLKSQNNFSPTINKIKINSLVFLKRNQKKLNHVFIRQFSSTPSTTLAKFFGERSSIEAILLLLNCIFLGIVYYLNNIITHLKNENLYLMETVQKVNTELLEVKEILNTNFQQLDKIESLVTTTEFNVWLSNNFIPVMLILLGFVIMIISVDQSRQTSMLADKITKSSEKIIEHTDKIQSEITRFVAQGNVDLANNTIQLTTDLGKHLMKQHQVIGDLVVRANTTELTGSVLPILEQMNNITPL